MYLFLSRSSDVINFVFGPNSYSTEFYWNGIKSLLFNSNTMWSIIGHAAEVLYIWYQDSHNGKYWNRRIAILRWFLKVWIGANVIGANLYMINYLLPRLSAGMREWIQIIPKSDCQYHFNPCHENMLLLSCTNMVDSYQPLCLFCHIRVLKLCTNLLWIVRTLLSKRVYSDQPAHLRRLIWVELFVCDIMHLFSRYVPVYDYYWSAMVKRIND